MFANNVKTKNKTNHKQNSIRIYHIHVNSWIFDSKYMRGKKFYWMHYKPCPSSSLNCFSVLLLWTTTVSPDVLMWSIWSSPERKVLRTENQIGIEANKGKNVAKNGWRVWKWIWCISKLSQLFFALHLWQCLQFWKINPWSSVINLSKCFFLMLPTRNNMAEAI